MNSRFSSVVLVLVGLSALVSGGGCDTPPEGLAGVSSIVRGSKHTCGIKEGGVVCRGDNSLGQIGDGTPLRAEVPRPVVGLEAGVSAIAAGYNHTCGIRDGGVLCWGDNAKGQVGDGTSLRARVPKQVVGLEAGVSAIVAGEDRACAIKRGSVLCWGDGFVGVGDEVTEKTFQPVKIDGIRGAETLYLDYEYACAMTSVGEHCWGHKIKTLQERESERRKWIAFERFFIITLITGGVGVMLYNIIDRVTDWGDDSFANKTIFFLVFLAAWVTVLMLVNFFSV